MSVTDTKVVIRLSFLIALFAVILYSNTLHHGFVLDDYSVIKENRLTRGGTSSLKQILSSSYREGHVNNDNNLYRPLTKAMFAVEWQLSPDNPSLHHAINIGLYAVACVLLFLVLLMYTKINIYVLFIAVLLFAAHPIHTEVVANIKSRDEISSMIFLLLSLVCISKYLSGRNTLMLATSLSCFFLALLSKESAIVYVALVPLFIYFFTGTSLKNAMTTAALTAGVAIAYMGLHISVIGSIGEKHIPVIDNTLMYTTDVIQRKATAVLIMGKYLLLLIFPHPLSSDYSFNTIRIVTSLGNVWFLSSLAVHLFLLYYAVRKVRERHIVSFCIFFYLISMSLASNLFMLIGTHLAERLLFFPSIAFCLAVVYLLSRLSKTDLLDPRLTFRQINGPFLLIAVTVLTLYSVKTVSRNSAWKSDTTLFATDLETVPNSAHMLFYYANALANKESLAAASPPERERRLRAAQESIGKALSLYEVFPDAYDVAGRVSYEQKDYEEAFRSYRRAVQLNPGRGTYHNNIGTCLFAVGKYEEAAQAFQKAIELDRYDAEARCNLGSAYGAMGEAYKSRNELTNANRMFMMAIENFQKATQMDPNYRSPWQLIGVTYKNMGDSVTGQKYLDKAAQIKDK